MEKSISILIVDDDLGMLKTLNYILTEKGYEVVAVNNGLEAIELIKKRSFDIVLTDIKMPEINGVQLLKEIKKLSPQTNVMMITAYTMHELVQEAKKGGANAIFSKPLDLDSFISYTEELKNINQDAAQDDGSEYSELFQILEDREREIREKNLLIDELKNELAEIKKNPTELFEEKRRRIQSENIHDLLSPKQYELFKLLSQGEKNYEELFKETQRMGLDIRDMAALRLQLSRLNNKLEQDTIYKVERIHRNKSFLFRISSGSPENDS